MPEFVHLNVHSQYSLLDGAIRLKDLFTRVKELDMKAVALTDSGNMFGAVDFFKKAKKAGVKPIIGTELYVAEFGRHSKKQRSAHNLVLLAKNEKGYENLRFLSSMAWREGFYYRPRIDLELLRAHSEGLIGLSASGRGQIGRALREDNSVKAESLAIEYRDAFEPGAFYLEVRGIDTESQAKVNAGSRVLGTKLGIPLVATNACHYLDRKMARAHEVLLCVQQGRTFDDPRRIKQESDGYWFKPADVMWAELGGEFADALENALAITDAIDFEMKLGDVFLPTFEVPAEHDTASFLEHCTREGLEARFREFEAVGKTVDRDLYRERIEMELGVIEGMKFPGYFLIVQDFINWAKDHDIPVGPGRGSGAGSLVAYALRITDIDPIPYGLLFERFLNPERVSMPDFDIDFCMNRRGEVIDYVTRKYGEKNVGQIATFGSLKAKGVIKDVGRVLGLSYGETDKLSKLVPDVLGITLAEAIDQEPKLKELYEDDPRVHDLLDIALSLEGLHRQVGMHAAGVVIGDKPIWDYVPVCNGANDELVTQFAKDEVEEAGLVKFDFLGLKTLTVIDDAVKMVNRGRAPEDRLDMNTLGLDDPGVYALISRADTEGVFQLESSGFQELLTKLKPDKFEDIVAAVALYRPGPLNSGMLDDFIARKHGRQEIRYPHPKLGQILQETYGVIVYQEQVMQIAQVLAGFSLGAADLLRRAMGKKKAEVMAKQRVVFKEGAQARGVDEAKATEIFDLMEMFAQYGFNKSHSAAYALLTYQTGYLKAHHKVEFMAALLTNDRDNADKVTKGIRNARKIGIEVLPPDVNRSQSQFDAVEGKILFGMAGVKGVGGTAVEAIVEAREDGPFETLLDFCKRVDLRRVNKKTIEALIKAGAFDFCDEPRARLVASVELAVERAQQSQRDAASGQASFFAVLAGPTGDDDQLPEHLQDIEEWPEQVLLAAEKESLGFYVSGHPLDRFEEISGKYATATVEGLSRLDNYAEVVLAGVQTSVRVRPFKKKKGKMAIILFEDVTGAIELIAMGEEFEKYEALLTSDEPVLVRGTLRVDRDEDRTNISVRLGRGRRRFQQQQQQPVDPENEEPLVVSLAEIRATRSKGLQLTLPTSAVDDARLTQLRALLTDEKHQGGCQAWLELITDDDCSVKMRLGDIAVAPNDDLDYALRRLFDDQVEITVR